jgi:hypothetical protein
MAERRDSNSMGVSKCYYAINTTALLPDAAIAGLNAIQPFQKNALARGNGPGVCILDLGARDSEPNPRRFHEFTDGAKYLCAAFPCSIGLVQADFAALSKHFAHEHLGPNVIALKPIAS